MCRVAKAASCQNGQVFRVTYQAEVYTDTVDGGQIQKYRIKTLLISTVLFLICNPSVFYGGGYISLLYDIRTPTLFLVHLFIGKFPYEI